VRQIVTRNPGKSETPDMDIVVACVALGLMAYLFLALIRPEWF
jgi:K+-transporting ATPase KdpF subunit